MQLFSDSQIVIGVQRLGRQSAWGCGSTPRQSGLCCGVARLGPGREYGLPGRILAGHLARLMLDGVANSWLAAYVIILDWYANEFQRSGGET